MVVGRKWREGWEPVDWSVVAAIERALRVRDEGIVLCAGEVRIPGRTSVSKREIALAVQCVLNALAGVRDFVPSLSSIIGHMLQEGRREEGGGVVYVLPHEIWNRLDFRNPVSSGTARVYAGNPRRARTDASCDRDIFDRLMGGGRI